MVSRFALLAVLAALCVPCVSLGQDDIVDKGGLPVSVDLHHGDVRDFLKYFFKDFAPYKISPDVSGQLTGTYKSMLREDVLKYVLPQVHATYKIDSDGTFEIFTDKAPPGPYQISGDPSDSLVTVSFHDTPVRTAIEELFKGRAPVIIFRWVDGKVNGDFKSARFAAVLNRICKQAGAVASLSHDIYLIQMDPQRSIANDWQGRDTSFTLDLDNVAARDVFDILLTEAVGFAEVDDAIPDTISMHGSYSSDLKATSAVADQTSCEVYLSDGVFIVRKRY